MDFEKAIRLHKTVERFWLIVLILSVLATIYYSYKEGIAENKFMIVVPVLAALWYMFRRGFRKRLERQYKEQQGDQ